MLRAVAAPSLFAFVAGAGLLALWIDVRFPKLAPRSLSRRVLAAASALLVLEAVPVLGGSAAAVYASLFAIVLPMLVSAFLAAVWLLRALRDAQLNA